MSSVLSRAVRIATNSSSRDALVDVDVVALLLADRGLPAVLVAAGRLVVVAEEQAGRVGQREQLADRAVELPRVAAGEVAAGGAVVGHEQRVADEGGVADRRRSCRPACGRACGAPGPRSTPSVNRVAVGEQAVELAAVALELGAGVEDLAEHVLDHGDARGRCPACRRAAASGRARPRDGRRGRGSRAPTRPSRPCSRTKAIIRSAEWRSVRPEAGS